MKKSMTILLSLFVVAVFAQERKATNVQKTVEEIQGRCMSVTGASNYGSVVEAILGPGVTYSNVSSNGLLGAADVATIGFTDGANCVPLGFNSGVLLSSGFVSGVVGPNSEGDFSGETFTGGDADLASLIPGFSIFDATWIKFDFVTAADTIFIQYVFGSDEYPEYAGSVFNDVFGFFVNGINIARVPGTALPVTINNVNHFTNSSFYRSNHPGPFNIEADGMTTVLTAIAPVNPGVTNTIKIGIADAGDRYWDSWVFVKAGSFSPVNPELPPPPPPPPIPVSDWALYLGILLMVTFVVIRFRRMI